MSAQHTITLAGYEVTRDGRVFSMTNWRGYGRRELDQSLNDDGYLAWGTPKENADDRERHGRTSRGESHSRAIKASGHAEAVRAARRLQKEARNV